MGTITHRTINTNGIKMHIAEQGSGPVVLLIHGFPELWYSWRHQIPVLAEAGYHAVAPDLRGYGETDAPNGVQNYTCFHLVGDLIGLLDGLGVEKAFVVGHDWGAILAWYLCCFRPDRVHALVNLSVAFSPRRTRKPVELMKAALGEGYYICRFQEPGRAEADFARYDCTTIFKKFLSIDEPEKLFLPLDKDFVDMLKIPTTLPPWISEEEINYFAKQFQKTGFTGGFNYYRAIDLNWELLAPWAGTKVTIPTKFVVGDQDVIYNLPGAKDYIHKGRFKKDVPSLAEVVVIEGGHHFIQQEKPEEISHHILKFFGSFSAL